LKFTVSASDVDFLTLQHVMSSITKHAIITGLERFGSAFLSLTGLVPW